MTVDILATVVFLSVAILCLLLGAFEWWRNRCTSYNGKHLWKRISAKYYGEPVPHTIELHLKCSECGKEVKKEYQI